tara:strand:- start:1583 stop:2065 length:483 start_codon:yes stop_codon:yes gene_type:complete
MTPTKTIAGLPMTEKKKMRKDRWTWDDANLVWNRKNGKVKTPKPASLFTTREKDISDRNLMKQYKWILDQEYAPDSKELSKNTLVKRIPALSKATAKATRNSVDGRLRSIFLKIEKAIQTHPDKKIAMPLKLEWYRPAKSTKASKAKKKMVDDIQAIFGF